MPLSETSSVEDTILTAATAYESYRQRESFHCSFIMAPVVDQKPAISNPMTENIEDASKRQSPGGNDCELTSDEKRKIIRKIDCRLVIMLGAMYCVSLIDRTNLSNAAIAGMTSDLNLNEGFRYVCYLHLDRLLCESHADDYEVHHRSCVLRHLYRLPATRHYPNPIHRSEGVSGRFVHRLGNRHGTLASVTQAYEAQNCSSWQLHPTGLTSWCL